MSLRDWIPVVALASALAFTGCAADEPDATGSVELALVVAPGVSLDSASYVVIGPASFRRTGDLDVRNSTQISLQLGALPAGTGFSLTITASLTGAVATCSGTTGFDIIAGMVTRTTIHLLCREPPATGGVVVDGTVNVCPAIDAISASPAEAQVGSSVALAAAAHDLDRVPMPVAYAWSAPSGTIVPPTGSNPVFTCAVAGDVTVTLTVSDGDCTDTTTAIVACSPATGGPAPEIKLNEIESSGGVPGDWVELFNPGSSAVDLSGWVFRDNDDSHTYVIPNGTTIASGGTVVLEESAIGFGLGAADSARLYRPDGTTIVDAFSWTSHATTTYGRCPNGTGTFVTTTSVTKGAANACPAAPDPGAGATLPWPGANTVAVVDPLNQFASNLSGLFYESGGAAPVLWAVQNGPSTLYRLVSNGTSWIPASDGGWSVGKTLRYPDGPGGPGGSGAPDSEGVTRAELSSPAIYVAAERDNDNNGTSRLSVLRFDTSATGSSLVATHEWNLTADLPAVGANLGLEGITWIPDANLVALGLVDDSAALPYDPARYPNHGTGIFFVGVEATGMIYAYALDHSGGAFHRIASITSGQPAVMDLSFDRELGYLWAYCDNTCGNKASILTATAGHFQLARFVDHPSTLGDFNNEGIAFAPLSECVAGQRSFFWSDDSNTAGHSLRRDSIPCSPLF